MRAKYLKRDPRLWAGFTAFLLLVFSAVMFWERQELSLALAAGDIEALLENPGRFMNASLIVASGITLMSFGTLYLCHLALSNMPLPSMEGEEASQFPQAKDATRSHTSLMAAAEGYRTAEAEKDRALELAILRERERVMELLGSGATEFTGHTLGFDKTQSYREFRELEADLVVGLYRLRNGQADAEGATA